MCIVPCVDNMNFVNILLISFQDPDNIIYVMDASIGQACESQVSYYYSPSICRHYPLCVLQKKDYLWAYPMMSVLKSYMLYK